MSLNDYLDVARRRWWIVVLTALVAAAAALLFSRLQTPIYKSTMEVFIQPARADFGLSESSRKLIASYIAIVNSKRSADRIAADLRLDRSGEYIFGNTTMGEDGARYAIQIAVKDDDGETANRIARRWAELIAEFRDIENAKNRREDRVDAKLGDDPKYVQDFPRTRTYVAAAGVLGALVGLLIVAAAEFSQASILRNARDVQRALELNVLGSVPGK
jgi:capsular polysaccharide biosynthesis protein